MTEKETKVIFANKNLQQEFDKLKEGKFEDRQLYLFLSRAISDIEKNPSCGIKLPEKIWPSGFAGKFAINNLWKYDLPDGWRLIYTIKANDVAILSIILEWFSHKGYERRFNY